MIKLENSGSWKTAEIIINDARFSGRCNSGDFRFQSVKDGLWIRRAAIIAANDKAQKQNRIEYAKRPEPLEKKMIKFKKTREDIILAVCNYYTDKTDH